MTEQLDLSGVPEPEPGRAAGTYNTNHWNQDRRLEFIDFRLSMEGRINRQDLVKFFNISIPQASLDMSEYINRTKAAALTNIWYDRHLKTYRRADDFSPLFPRVCTADNYLNDLLLFSRNELMESRNFFGFLPSVHCACMSPPRRSVNLVTLRQILDAIRTKCVTHIIYMGLDNDEDVDLLIAPHALAFDGMRWHVRAYCYQRHAFRDYVLSRIMQCDPPKNPARNEVLPNPEDNGFREVGVSGEDDHDWNEIVPLELKANPDLPARARRVIEHDYGMGADGIVIYECRRAMVFYALRTFRLTPEDKSLPPAERQLVLANEEAVFGTQAGAAAK